MQYHANATTKKTAEKNEIGHRDRTAEALRVFLEKL